MELPLIVKGKTRRRSFEITITDGGNHLKATFKFSKIGRLGDESEFQRMAVTLLHAAGVDDDPRPVRMVNPWSGERATVTSHVVLIEPPVLN